MCLCSHSVQLGQFMDDGQSSRLRTLLAHYPPAHFLYERRGVGSQTTSLINQLLPSNIREALVPSTLTAAHEVATDSICIHKGLTLPQLFSISFRRGH